MEIVTLTIKDNNIFYFYSKQNDIPFPTHKQNFVWIKTCETIFFSASSIAISDIEIVVDK